MGFSTTKVSDSSLLSLSSGGKSTCIGSIRLNSGPGMAFLYETSLTFYGNTGTQKNFLPAFEINAKQTSLNGSNENFSKNPTTNHLPQSNRNK